jgi:glucan 1,3-beta-glucosidase
VHRALALAVLAAALSLLLAWAVGRTQPVDLPAAGAASLPCVSYAPFRRAGLSPFDPTLQVTPAEIEADLRLLATLTRCVRTYGLDHGIDAVPEVARKLGLRVLLGAWIGRDPVANEAQLARALELARSHADVIDLLIVGNEVLLRRELSPPELAQLLERARRESKVPVAYADVWEFWLRHAAALRDHVDVVVAHILPYWEDEPVAIDDAVDHVYEIAAQVKAAFAPLPVLIGETGWPAAGRQRGPALPGTLEQTRFVRELLARHQREPLPFNLIEGFDQPWKRALEGAMGGAWGVVRPDGSTRVTLAGPVVPDPQASQVLRGAALGAVLGLLVALLTVKRRAQRGGQLATGATAGAIPGVIAGVTTGVMAGVTAGALIAALGVVQWQALHLWSRNPLEWLLGGLTAVMATLASLAAAARLLALDSGVCGARSGIAATLRGNGGPHTLAITTFGWLFAAGLMALGLVFDARYRPLAWWMLAGPATLLLALALLRDRLVADAREERALAALCALCAPWIAVQEGFANTQALLVAALLLVTAVALLGPHRPPSAPRASTSSASSTAGAANSVE